MKAPFTPAAPTPKGLPAQLGRNSASGLLRFGVLTVVNLITYPYMLHRLGSERFGLWVLALVIGQTLPMLDLGIAGALMKLVPPFWSRGEKKRILELGSTATVLLLSVGSLCGLVIVALRQPMVHWLRIPDGMGAEMAWLLAGMAGVSLVNLITAGWGAVLTGIQRMDLSNGAYTWASVVHAAGIFVVLENGYGLMGLLANTGLMALHWWVLSLFFLSRHLPGFGLHPGRVTRDDARSLLQYGAKLQAAGAGGFLTIPVIKVILSRYVSLASVSFFELASGITMQLRSAFLLAAMPLTPAAAELQSAQSSEGVNRLYRSSFRLLFLGALPAFSLGAALAPGFVAFWLGSQNQIVAGTLGLLFLGWFINTLTLPAYFILQGQGLARYQAYFAGLQLACAVLFSFLLAGPGGYYGAVLGLVAALTVSAIYLLWQYHRISGIRFVDVVDASLLRVFVGNAILLGLFFLSPGWRDVSHLALLVALSVLYLGTYALLLLAFRRSLQEDLQALALLYPGGLSWLTRGWMSRNSPEPLGGGEVSASK